MTHVWRGSNLVYSYWHNDTNPTNQHSGPSVTFSGNKPGQTSGPLYVPPRVWNTIDLKPLGVSASAQFARGSAHLIITESSPNLYDELTCTVRPPGSTFHEANYQMQALAAVNSDGARGAQPWHCNLVNGQMQLYWNMKVGGLPADNNSASGFLLNMWLEQWGEHVATSEEPPAAIIPVPPWGTTIKFEQTTS